MKPHIFPNCRHIVVVGDHRFPVPVIKETPLCFETPVGLFMKTSGRKWNDPKIRFEGPFTAEGDMEERP